MTRPPPHDKRLLLATIGAILAAVVLLATAVSARSGWLDRFSAASKSSTSPAREAAAPATDPTAGGPAGSVAPPPTRGRPGWPRG